MAGTQTGVSKGPEEMTTPASTTSPPQQQQQAAPKSGGIRKKFAGVDKKSIPNSVKKKRINFRLRKVIVPKSPIMVLNEMVGPVIYTFVDGHPPMPMMNCPPMQLFTATCTVEGEAFSGTGPSKQIAKNICAEQVVRYIVTKRAAARGRVQVATEGGEAAVPKPHEMQDETPWAQLASLALFKLFNDWQAQGYAVPNELFKAPDYFNNQGMAPPKANPTADSAGNESSGPVPLMQLACKKMPDNPTDRHPVQLLNEVRGSINYELVEKRGENPHATFVLSVYIDGRPFYGHGKNKKEAKRACAVNVLKELYGIVYPDAAGAE